MDKQEAKEIYDATVRIPKDLLEIARGERADRKAEYDDACKQAKKAYEEYKAIAKEAQTTYYRNIGEV